MASGEGQSQSEGLKLSASSSSSQNDCDESQRNVLPNNLELTSHSKRSKIQRNKGKSISEATSYTTDNFSSDSVTFQNIPRTKCNTTSCLQDLSVNNKTRRKNRYSEEVFSDINPPLSLYNDTNFSVNHTTEIPEQRELTLKPSKVLKENQNTTFTKVDCKKDETDSAIIFERLSQLQDFILEATSLCQEQEIRDPIMREEFNNMKEAMKKVMEGEGKHKLLLEQMDSALFNEEHTNKSNPLFEKVQQSEKRLRSLKGQEACFSHIQKICENKLSSHQGSDLEFERFSNDEMYCLDDQPHGSRDSFSSKEAESEKKMCDSNNSSFCPFEEDERHMTNLRELQNINQLCASLECIKKKVQSIELNPDCKNMARSDKPDEFKLQQQVKAVEAERKKLKNKLLDLQEKKKINAEMIRKLDKSRVKTGDSKSKDVFSNLSPTPQKKSQSPSLKHKKSTKISGMTKRDNRKDSNSGFPVRRHYEAEGRANEDADITIVPVLNEHTTINKRLPDIQERLRKLQITQKKMKMLNDIIISIQDAKELGRPIPLEHQQVLSYLTNGEIEESSSESSMEGNVLVEPEIKQIDTFSAVNSVGANRRTTTSKSDIKLSEELKQKLIDNITDSYQRGQPLPSKHFNVLIDLFGNIKKHSDTDSESGDDQFDFLKDCHNFISKEPKDKEMLRQSPDYNEQDDICCAGSSKTDIPSGIKNWNKFEKEFKQFIELSQRKSIDRNSKSAKKREFPAFHSSDQFRPISATGKDDKVRSSGEGENTLHQNHDKRLILDQAKPQVLFPYDRCQENLLLTRQNIATMETRNQSHSQSLENRGYNTKKDNINHLSSTMGKLSNQSAVKAPFCGVTDSAKDNLDSLSILSSELNETHGEVEQKILDILKCNGDKQFYYRNEGNCALSNSSIESEPCGDSNEAFQPERTVDTMWEDLISQEKYDESRELSRNLGMQCGNTTETSEKSCHNGINASKRGIYKQVKSGIANEVPLPDPLSSHFSKCLQSGPSTHFLQQLKKQVSQLNALCQEGLYTDDQRARNYPPNICNNLPLTNAHTPAIAPDNIHPCNQHLLLCLSQCYHTLYMQQLEIQRLRGSHRNNTGVEETHGQVNSQDNDNEISFHPWCFPTPINSFMPSFEQPSQQASSGLSTNYFSNPLSYTPSIPSASARPLQAVIHPATQDNLTVQETLNNQVPPRTRANNFWDNFRSYSRQNMFSTSNNVKRNKSTGPPVAPQVRQVHPMVSNESMNYGQEASNSFPFPVASDLNRSFVNLNRSLPKAHFQDFVNVPKRMYAEPSTKAQCGKSVLHKNGTSVNLNTTSGSNINVEQAMNRSLSTFSTANLVHLNPVQDESKIGNLCSNDPNSVITASSLESTSQHTINEPDFQSDFLLHMYREAKALKSDQMQQQALNIVRDLVLSEKESIPDLSTSSKTQNDSSSFKPRAVDLSHIKNPPSETNVDCSDTDDPEKSTNRFTDGSLQWASQNLPTAAISPLSKEIFPRPGSTGAVRKKTLQSTCFWDRFSNEQASTSNFQENDTLPENNEISISRPIKEHSSDFLESTVENIMFDLQEALPFGQMREDSSLSFWSSINAYIINRIRSHINVPLSHKSLASLRQSLDHDLPMFSGMKFCDCESEFLKYISQFLYDSLSSFMSTGRFSTPQTVSFPPHGPSALETENTQDLNSRTSISIDKTCELRIKMPAESIFPAQVQSDYRTTESDYTCNLGSFQPIYTMSSEAKVEYEWEPEAEIEPEVEAGTEADLAEADQSPGQGNTSVISQQLAELSLTEHASSMLGNLSNGRLPVNGGINETADDSPEIKISDLFSTGVCAASEINSNDVLTKYCSSEEGSQKLEDQSAHSSVIDTKQSAELVTERNCNENEDTSTK